MQATKRTVRKNRNKRERRKRNKEEIETWKEKKWKEENMHSGATGRQLQLQAFEVYQSRSGRQVKFLYRSKS